MTKPREAVTFALAGVLIVGVIGLILTAGQESFRIFRFWGLIVGLVVWPLHEHSGRCARVAAEHRDGKINGRLAWHKSVRF